MIEADSFKKYINKTIFIKEKKINKRLFLAPMAGLGHVAFRELISEFGGFGLLFTGMCSAKALPHENPEKSLVFKWQKKELPHLVCQIFGNKPDIMTEAAKRVEQEGFFGVDLNFGCSVAAICKQGSGAALLKDPDLAMKIVKQVRQSVSIPLFVKFRTGWEDNPIFASDMAKRFEDAGADALVFHPRVAPDRRSRPPRWNHISQVKNAVSIPVFGNGNIFDQSDCIKVLKETGCSGLSLGRIAIAKPWIFASITEGFVPDSNIHSYTAMRMTQLLLKHYDEKFAVKLFKKFIPYFSAGFRFGHSMCKQLLKGETMDEIRDNIDCIFQNAPETTLRPNLNMFL
ncbi:MAG: tRNA-dihydrouridine synthase family protein [Thermodesulfobacteriota bacterium]|nr:tRNA-dihydrouridine synthase family protein [Thermodesulfobacteriota bacterium]